MLVLTIMLTYLIVNSRQTAHQNSERIDSICKSFSSVGNLEVTPTTTINGVTFIVVHRNAAIKLGCGNLLVSPVPELLNKVREFNLQLDG